MNDRLGMYQHLDTRRFHTKKPTRLNHLEALVHHGSRVDGNLGTHGPIGMLQGTLRRYRSQLLGRHQSERTARSRQKDFIDLVGAFASQRLENGRMLAVDRNDGHAILTSQTRHQLSGYDERFLIGQGYLLTGTDGMNRRLQTGETNQGRQYHIDHGALDNLTQGFGTGIHLDGQIRKGFLQLLILLGIGYDHRIGLETASLLNEEVHLIVSREHNRLEQVGVLVYHLQCLCSDGAGRPQYGYSLLHVVIHSMLRDLRANQAQAFSLFHQD